MNNEFLENAIRRLDNMLDADYSTYPKIVDLLEEVYFESSALKDTLIKQWEINHFLTCLAEECGEVMEVMYLDPNNKEKIGHELNDIIAVAHLLHDKDILRVNLEVKQSETISNKRNNKQR